MAGSGEHGTNTSGFPNMREGACLTRTSGTHSFSIRTRLHIVNYK